MHARLRLLLPTLALGGALLVGSTPALAGSTAVRAWYVGPSAPTTAGVVPGCDTPDFGDLQAAIEASGVDETIIVCDGTYVGAFTIDGHGHDGLTLQAARQWQATLLAPPDAQGDSQLAIENADNVTVKDLRFKGRDACVTGVGSAIAVDTALNVDLRANRLVGGTDSLGTGCGFGNGVTVQRATGRIRYNLIVDWRDNGIFVPTARTEGGRMRVTENSLRFNHTGLTGLGSGSRAGIVVYAQIAGFRTIIERNVVTVAKTGGMGVSNTPTLRGGIAWEADRVTVRGNRIRRADLALASFGGSFVYVTDNNSRGITYDCYSEGPIDGWSGNIGRTSKSLPAEICSLSN